MTTTTNTAAASGAADNCTILPDGSAFAVGSFPLPQDHWLYAPHEYEPGSYEPKELLAPILTHAQRNEVVAAVRYAVRGATMCGKEPDFDPDALVQNAVYALCGSFGRTTLATTAQAAPADRPGPSKAITASIMRDGGGDHPAFCLMVAYRSQADAEAALELLTAAPTTQPAPQQEAQEPVAVVVPCHTPSGKRVALYSAKQDLPIGTQLYTAPQPSPAAQVAESVPAPPPPPECETEAEKRAFAFGWFKALESERMKAYSVLGDAARYRWLRDKNNPLEQFDYGRMHPNGTSCYHMVGGVRELKSGEELDCAIAAARAAQEGK